MRSALSILIACLWHITASSQPGRYDIVINEIMANPGSASFLPPVKYIELCNRSAAAINLQHWTISDGGNTATIRTDFLLQPDSFIVISSIASAAQLQPVVTAIGVSSFPSLRVNGDELVLRSPEGVVIHAVAYSKSWYTNEVKSNGGWSLEMIDCRYPCTGNANWRASTDHTGGTPGRKNAVADHNPDSIPPVLLQISPDSLYVTLRFNESLDSAHAATIANYTIQGAVIVAAEVAAPFFTNVVLTLSEPVANDLPYMINVQDIRDCAGNSISPVTVPFGRPVKTMAGDVVFNEILFNPRENGVDYIELYNRGTHILNLRDLFINNRTGSGNPGTLRQISTEDRLFFPGDYVLLSENSEAVQQQYATQNPAAFWQMNALPSMPNAAGHILLFNPQGETIDELQYDEKWHFPLVANPRGVALERTDPDKPTQDKSNWHSAAASVGYGTPGYQNSQFTQNPATEDEISITPRVFSPDNDGFDDFLTISYRFPEPGNVCNISIFDVQGRLIRALVRNALCGTEGSFRWDGLDADHRQLRIGIYVVHMEIFHPGGKTRQFTKAVTLARRI